MKFLLCFFFLRAQRSSLLLICNVSITHKPCATTNAGFHFLHKQDNMRQMATLAAVVCILCCSEVAGLSIPGDCTVLPASGSQTHKEGSSQYSNDEDLCWKVPACGTGYEVTVSFSAFDVESGYDFVTVWADNGAGVYGQVSQTSGTNGPADAKNGAHAVAVQFKSDYSVTRAGFTFAWSCVATGTPPPTPAPTAVPTAVPTPVPTAVPCPPRVRHAWSQLSCADREHYIAAVAALKTQKRSVYDEIEMSHVTNSEIAHGTSAFLPWHRWFVLGYENALRSLPGFECVTVPYWDWEQDMSLQTCVWKMNTFGPTNPTGTTDSATSCVDKGVAAGWTTSQPGNPCLKRHNPIFGGGPYGAANVGREVVATDYASFSAGYESGAHQSVHSYIGETMTTSWSPADPLFFLHHANIDRTYALWQDYHGYSAVAAGSLTTTHYEARYEGGNVADVTLDATLPFAHDTTGTTSEYLAGSISARSLHNIQDMPGGNSYTYGVDGLARFIVAEYATTPVGGWTWLEEASAALTPVTCCGDGSVDDGEQCDDGNTVDGDGCSATCMST